MLDLKISKMIDKDIEQLLRAVNKPNKCLRDILNTNDEVNVWLYVRKKQFSDSDAENISSDIIDYCYKYHYNICGITISEESSAFSKTAIPFIMDNANVNCILSPSASNLTRNLKDFSNYIRLLKSRGIYFETLDSGAMKV